VGFYLQKGVSRPKEQAFLEAVWKRAGYFEGARLAVIRGQVTEFGGAERCTLIGGGQTHQENYARAFAADPRCRLVGLADEPDVPARRRALNEQLADDLSIPHFDDLDQALRREDVHLVSVCVESERMGRVAARAARAGKHVYVDKPLAVRVDEASAFVRAAREALVLTQMFSMFFAKGTAGTADLSRPRREKHEHGPFTFIDSKRELFTIGLYPLVLFHWLTGRRVERVYCTTSNYFFAEHQHNDVEDFACLLLRLEGGIDATIDVGRTGWTSHPASGVHQVHLVGTQGTEKIDAFRPRLEIYSDAGAWQPPDVQSPDDPMGFWSSTQTAAGVKPKHAWQPIAPAITSDTSYFLDCLDVGRESDVSAAVGAHAVEVLLAAYNSAAEGQPVKLRTG